MAKTAFIVGLIGFLLELLWGLTAYVFVLDAGLSGEQPYATVASQLQYLAFIALPIAGLVGAWKARTKLGLAAVVMLACSAALAWLHGVTKPASDIFLITIPGALGGVFALIAALRGGGGRGVHSG